MNYEYVKLTVEPFQTLAAVVIDEINAGAVVLARSGQTVIDVDLTTRPYNKQSPKQVTHL